MGDADGEQDGVDAHAGDAEQEAGFAPEAVRERGAEDGDDDVERGDEDGDERGGGG